MNQKTVISNQKTEQGFIALISVVIISAVLVGLAFTVSASGFYARFDALNGEFKRVSLGLAESCQNVALLKFAQNYNYDPTTDPGYQVSLGGVPISVGPNSCIIKPFYQATVIDAPHHRKTVYIATQASYHSAFSNIQVASTVQDPTIAPVSPPPTCTLSVTPTNIFSGNSATLQWANSIGTSGLTITNSLNATVISATAAQIAAGAGQTTVTPSATVNYTATVTGPGGTNSCNPSTVSVIVQPPPACADTLMMLDRTGSMSSSDLSNERAAATALLNLYKAVVPPPQAAVGSFGAYPNQALPAGAAGVPVTGQLGTNYPNLTTTVNNITGSNSGVGSDLGAAINAGNTELNSARHRAGYQKVMVMISDGVPTEPSDTSGTAPAVYPATIGNFNSWNVTGTASKITAESDASNSTYISQGADAETFKLSNASLPAGATVDSVVLNVVAKSASGSPNIKLMVENAGNTNLDAGHNLSGSYVTYNWTMNTNPLTGSAWTYAEVTNWTTKFGVYKSNASGIVHVTNIYAVVNFKTSSDTNYVSPSAQSADTGGDGNGFEGSPNNAFADGGGFATNLNGAGDRHRYYNYNLSIPPGATVNGIVVRPDWWLDSTSSTNDIDIELSWNGGSSWTSSKNEGTETTSDTNNKLVGSSNDTWGRTWSLSDFTNSNFRVRITMNSTSSSRDFFLDWLPVRVYYSTPGSSTSTPTIVGAFDSWVVNTGAKPAAVASNDSDTTYISEGTLAQSFGVANANVPAGAVIDSVTFNALAEETSGNASIQLMAENGANQVFDSGHNLSGSYVTYNWIMNTNPLTGLAWTYGEVTNWTTKFGVFKSSPAATAQVSQMSIVVDYTIPGDPFGFATAAANTAKTIGGIQIFAIHFGSASGQPFLESLASQNMSTINIAATGAVRAGNVVTITTSAPHGFFKGEQVQIAGVSTASFNGTFVIASVPTSTTFTYSQTGSNATSGNGTATVNQNFFISPAAADMQGIFQAIAGIVCPAAAAPPPPPPLPPAPPPPPLPPNITLGSWIENK